MPLVSKESFYIDPNGEMIDAKTELKELNDLDEHQLKLVKAFLKNNTEHDMIARSMNIN